MPRSLPLASIPLATLLALVGCSAPEPEPTGSTAPSSESSTDESTPESLPSASAGSGTYSSAELTGFLETVTDADGAALRVIPTAQIEQSMEQAQQFLDAVVTTPEECEVFVSNSLDVPDGAGYATGVSGVDGDAIQTIVSVYSSSDSTFSEERREASADAQATCSSFTVDARGVEIEQTVETLDAVTGAEETDGVVTRQSSSDGATQETMTIVATSGELAVTAVRTAPGEVPEGTQEQLQELIDATFVAVG